MKASPSQRLSGNSGQERPSYLTHFVSLLSCTGLKEGVMARCCTSTLRTHCTQFHFTFIYCSRPERIKQIANKYGIEPDGVLNNIMVGRAFTVDGVNNLIMQAAAAMIEDQFALLIVDSIMAPFRVDYSGRGELSERQQVLGRMLSKLQKISEQFNIAVFITNQVMADPGGGMTYAVDPKKPVGGHILAHASTTRLFLRKGKGDQRVCKIYDSPSIPEGEAIFQISDGGIIDATE